MAVLAYLGFGAFFTILAAIIPVYLFRDFAQQCLQKCLARIFVPIRHKDGHMLPGAPLKMQSYFKDAAFFGWEHTKRYGKMYYLWHGLTPIVMVADREAIRNFYKDHFSHFRDSDFVILGKKFRDTLGSCMGCSSGKDRAKQYRGFFEPYLATSSANALHVLMSQAADEWISALDTSKPINFEASGMTHVPIRVLTCVAYGEELSERHMPRLKEFTKLYVQATAKTGAMFEDVSLTGKVAPEVTFFTKEWNKFHHMLLEEGKSIPQKVSGSILFTLHEQIENGEIKNLTETQLFQTICQIWLLNLDITVASTSILLYDLAKYPDIQDKVYEELDAVLSKLSTGDPGVLDDLANDLPYLHKVMKESARLHPMSITFPERTVKDVTNMAGYNIPKNTVICVDGTSLNRDPEFWSNPEEFDPERFNTTPAPYTYFRFGMGARKCLGSRMGLPMIAIGTAKVLRRFKIELTPGRTELEVPQVGIPVLHPFKAPPLTFKERHTGH